MDSGPTRINAYRTVASFVQMKPSRDTLRKQLNKDYRGENIMYSNSLKPGHQEINKKNLMEIMSTAGKQHDQ